MKFYLKIIIMMTGCNIYGFGCERLYWFNNTIVDWDHAHDHHPEHHQTHCQHHAQHNHHHVGWHLDGGGSNCLLLLLVFNQADLSLLNN